MDSSESAVLTGLVQSIVLSHLCVDRVAVPHLQVTFNVRFAAGS